MDQDSKIIPEEHRLPCDFIVGNTRFCKGVKLETVRLAAERWKEKAAENLWPEVTQEQADKIKALVAPEFETGDWQTVEKE